MKNTIYETYKTIPKALVLLKSNTATDFDVYRILTPIFILWGVLVLIFNTILNLSAESLDAPKPWGLYFQDSASPQMEALVELHDNIMFYLVIILFAVGWILIAATLKFIKPGLSN